MGSMHWVLVAPSGAHLVSREWNVAYVGIYAIVIMKLLLPIDHTYHTFTLHLTTSKFHAATYEISNAFALNTAPKQPVTPTLQHVLEYLSDQLYCSLSDYTKLNNFRGIIKMTLKDFYFAISNLLYTAMANFKPLS